MRKTLTVAAALATVAFAVPASAASVWLDSDNTPYNEGASTTGSMSFTGSDGVNVTARGYTVSNTSGNGYISTAKLQIWDQGLGIRASSDSSHTVDNSGSRDFIMLQFDQAVSLIDAVFNTGWYGDNWNGYYDDTDATIGYLASAIPFSMPSTLNGLYGVLSTYSSNAAANQWNPASGDDVRNINPQAYTSNLWLIGASFSNPDSKRDGFKLEKLTYSTTPAVPEPATWLMMILGFGLVGGVMRAKRNEKLTVSYS